LSARPTHTSLPEPLAPAGEVVKDRATSRATALRGAEGAVDSS
jgi:hypothetical protein